MALGKGGQKKTDFFFTGWRPLLREGSKKIRKKGGLLPTPPRAPPPRFGLFSVKKIDPHFFCWKMHLQWPKQILCLVPLKNLKKILFHTGPLFPRILEPLATFKAVLRAEYMT